MKYIKVFSLFFWIISLIFIDPDFSQAESGCKKVVDIKKNRLDDDFDGYPNFLEKAIGYSPKVNDCMKHMRCGKLLGDITRVGGSRNILLILDASGSMTTLAQGGKTRIDAAKEAVASFIKLNPRNVKLGLLVYSARGGSNRGCANIELVQPIEIINKKSLSETVMSIEAQGTTPMAFAINKAQEILEKYHRDDNHVILVSDGLESCKGNPVQALYELKMSKASPTIDVIGFGVGGRARSQLKCAAKAAQGQYYDVNSASDLTRVLAYSFDRMKDFYKTMVCINRDFNKFLVCETQKYNKANAWIIRHKLLEKDAEKKRSIRDAEEKIRNRYFNEVKKLSHGAFQKKIKNLQKEIDEVTRNAKRNINND